MHSEFTCSLTELQEHGVCMSVCATVFNPAVLLSRCHPPSEHFCAKIQSNCLSVRSSGSMAGSKPVKSVGFLLFTRHKQWRSGGSSKCISAVSFTHISLSNVCISQRATIELCHVRCTGSTCSTHTHTLYLGLYIDNIAWQCIS